MRQAYLSKPKHPLATDPHVYFAARTWKDRPSLRRNLENVKARVHRILPDGTVIGSWKTKEDYDESKSYLSEYQRKHSKAADLDFIESVKGLDHKDKLGRSLLEVLEDEDVHREGQLSLVFYPDYSEAQVKRLAVLVEGEYGPRGLKLIRLIPGLGRVTALFEGPLHLADELASRLEAVAVIEQVGDLRPAGPVAQASKSAWSTKCRYPPTPACLKLVFWTRAFPEYIHFLKALSSVAIRMWTTLMLNPTEGMERSSPALLHTVRTPNRKSQITRFNPVR